MSTILESIFNIETMESSDCQDCRACLSAYIDDELSGADAAARNPEVAEHMGTCHSCREEYDELRLLLSLERENALVEPPFAPGFDFSYLESSGSRRLWEQVAEIPGKIVQLVSEIRVTVQEKSLAFVAWPRFSSLQFALVPVTRSLKGGTIPPMQTLLLPSPEGDLQIGIVLRGASAGNAAFGARIAESASGKPRDRIRVTLRDPQKEGLLASNLTDNRGEVVFDRVAPGSYYVDVRYRESTIRLPIILAPEQRQ
jgi:hypothetical protein